LQLLLDQKECYIYMEEMENEDFKRDIKILMADQDVKFKVNTLIICQISRNQFHILNWLLLKSPNLIDLRIYPLKNDIKGQRLEI
jgi:hypothetical protein